VKTSLYQKCIENERFELLSEWDAEKNGALTPWTVSPGSHKEIWWRCKDGHEWQAAVYTRWAGHGCPTCYKQKRRTSLNDLASRYPELAAEWHPTRNGELRPEDLPAYARDKIWWRCKKGHEWQAAVDDRVAGTGCPYCSSRKLLAGFNDLTTTNPELVKEWHPTKNGTLTPDQVFPGSGKLVWWQCDKGHEWQAVISSRAKGGCGCPYCAGQKFLPGFNDLATAAPGVAAEWHPTKNGELRPDQIHRHSTRSVWWRCEKGHEWQATPRARVIQKSGCPVCSNKTILPGENDLATLKPELAAQWHPTKNGMLTPREVGAGSYIRAWWRCDKGHEWRATIASRASSGCGCPVCNGDAVIPGENDLATMAPTLAAEWHPTKNGDLTPEQVRAQSNRTVWWRCEKGHEWKTTVNARMQSGSGCPYCSNKKVLAGFNDLATLEPKIAAQWDTELNGALTPQMVSRGSKKKVWWHCSEGHVWRARIDSRAGPQKTGCPVCAGFVGKKRLEKMRQLEDEARAAQQLPLPERFIAAQNIQIPRDSAI